MLRVLIVDNHELVRHGVRGVLKPTVEIVGQAHDVDSAIEKISVTQPDVVLLDVHLPGGNGASVIAGATQNGVETTFLALSVSDAAEDVIEIIRAGARGYVTKSISPDDLVDAVRRVGEGDAVFSPRLQVSCSTLSPDRSPSQSIRTSTSSPHAKEKSCVSWPAGMHTKRLPAA